MAATKTTAPTVTLKHLSANVAETHELSKKQSEAILGNMVELVVKHLKKGDRIRIGGLGILQVRKRAARMGRNPATGEPIKIKASKRLAFRAAKELEGGRLIAPSRLPPEARRKTGFCRAERLSVFPSGHDGQPSFFPPVCNAGARMPPLPEADAATRDYFVALARTLFGLCARRRLRVRAAAVSSRHSRVRHASRHHLRARVVAGDAMGQCLAEDFGLPFRHRRGARAGVGRHTMATVVAPWTSTGYHQDGSTFDRPGRATMIFSKQNGAWLCTHSHMSLNRGVPQQTLRTGR